MGDASDPEAYWKKFFNWDHEDRQCESPGRSRDLTNADNIDVSNGPEAPNSHILDPVAGSTPKAHAKRDRSTNWSADEKNAYLEAKLEAELRAVKGKQWEFISRFLLDRYGFSRSPKQCEHRWGTFVKEHKEIIKYESKLGGPQTSDRTNTACMSYFDMDEGSRSSNNFLPLSCYQLMDKIFEEQGKGFQRRATSDHGGPSHTVVEKADDDALRSFLQHLKPFVKGKVEDAVNSFFENQLCIKTCRLSKSERDGERSLLAPEVKKLVKAVVNFNLKTLARTGYIFDANDPTTGLGPFVENCITDGLKNATELVSSHLEALEQKKLEAQKKRQDIKEKRLALDREEKEIEESERARRAIGGITKHTRTAQQTGRSRRGRRFPPLRVESSRQ